MPIKTSSGKWKWGNVERSSKKELVQTVYGIWKKNGSKGSFSDFLKGTHESIVSEYAGNKHFVKVDPRVQKYGQDTGYETLRSNDGKILGFKNSRGDCVIRALALATGLSYLNVAKKLHVKLDDRGDVPKDYDGTKWETVFEFFHKTAPSVALLGMKQNMTVKEFARTISRHSKFKNVYFIVGCTDPDRKYGHAVFVKNGRYYDSWDCGDWIVTDVFDATNERGLNAQDYRNIVQIRRGTKKRYKKTADESCIEERWSKNEKYFYCDDCGKNMVKAPDDQYIMIDDDLWEYVCKHGGKKLNSEDVLCRDCIEKRLGRKLELKDLKDAPVNDGIKKMLKKRKVKESVVSEGKHWPEDYVKTAFNIIKNSDLGKQSWYTDNYINQDLKSIVDEFGPLSHKNSNLGYFATIIKWFVQYAGKDKSKYQEFIERKLDGIIKTLLWLSNNPGEESKLKEQIKTKWTFEDFEKYQKEVENQISREQDTKLKSVKLQDKGYEIIPIDSYQELHEKFGGDKTGYKGDSKWCHTNGSSTYNSWTSGGKYNFFVLAKKGWEKIEPPNPADKTTKAYDEYGTSLIAILVDVASGKLLNATLRWNHVIEPSLERKGTSVDKAFLGWGDLAEVTGKDVEKEIKEKLKDKQEELQKEIDDANRQVNEYLERHKDKIKKLDPETNFKIINKFKDIVTEIKIPEGITSIGAWAFSSCSSLASITIPDSVTSIGNSAFENCSSLASITIPNSVTSIGRSTFSGCSHLMSITIPDSVTSIGSFAFSDCSGLTSITIPDGVTNVGSCVFYGCSGLTSITIPDGVTSIGYAAFQNCSGLTSITIPNSVTSIDEAAFAWCSGLTSISIPNSVTSIGNYAFYDCSGLTSVTIPSSATSIGDGVFVNCSKLKTIYCSEKIWNKFRDKFPEKAERKDPKEMKKESLNEAHEIHSYPHAMDSIIKKIEAGAPADYNLDHAYYNKEGKFIWLRNSKGYFHIFKPLKLKNVKWRPFVFKDLLLKDDGMLEEKDVFRFDNGHDGLKFMKDKYGLEIKTISQ